MHNEHSLRSRYHYAREGGHDFERIGTGGQLSGLYHWIINDAHDKEEQDLLEAGGLAYL